MARMKNQLDALAAAAADPAIRMRRDLHQHPEVAWTERRTTYRVAEALRVMGLDPRVRPDGTGLTVDVGVGPPSVGFRADIDALPIQERTDAPYRSLVDGIMHACGHDAHTAIAVGIADVLSQVEDLPGSVRIIFQPAEENLPSGAAVMVAEGAVAGLQSIIAFHVDPSRPAGTLGLKAGPITSAADRITIRLRGPGGHTSRPHQTVDLVQVAGRMVVDLPVRLRAEIDSRQQLVMVFGRISGGGADNAIPTEIEIGGTARVPDPELWQTLPKLVERLTADIALPLGASVELDHRQGGPPVVNDGAVIDVVRDTVVEHLGSEAAEETHQSMGSEDFSVFLQEAPGAMIRLGVGDGDGGTDLHSATFDLDEGAIETGILIGAASLIRLLRS
jgi:amidohydrolase